MKHEAASLSDGDASAMDKTLREAAKRRRCQDAKEGLAVKSCGKVAGVISKSQI